MVVTLAEDLVTEVLLRLPAKSLMRFKCVQRSWNALFRSSNFVSRQMQMRMRMQGSIEHLMVFTFDNIFNMELRMTLLMCDDPQPQPRPQAVEGYPFVDILPLGPCNGVFCLYGKYEGGLSQLILWNPATREVKLVPPPPHKPSHDRYLRYDLPDSPHPMLGVFRGFSADPNTNDLKVVNLVIDRKGLRPPSAELYALSTNSWTLIRNHTVPTTGTNIRAPLRTALVNGVCYWLTGNSTFGDPTDILCFAFRNNQFRKLKAPSTAVQGELADLNDSLAYIVNFLNGKPFDRAEIWILEQDSWTKKHSIRPLGLLVSIYAIWKDGAEFLGGGPDDPLLSYNSDAQPVCQFPVNVNRYFFYVHRYVESIAPLSF